MQIKVQGFFDRIGIKPYWFLIIGLLLLVGGIFGNHLRTGVTPGSAAISIGGFEIFWYGIFIVGGIALGAWVVSDLAEDRALRLFNKSVPQQVQQLAISVFNFSKAVQAKVDKANLKTVGDFLLPWGYNPINLGFKKEEVPDVSRSLRKHKQIKREWISSAPWKEWNPDHVWSGLMVSLIFAVIGARLYHVLTPSPSMAAIGIESPMDYFRNPALLVNLRAGGLGIYGGLAGGVFGLWLYTRRNKMSLLGWTDIAAAGVALGQVFGRWGNFFNQELYGRPTDLPWAITIAPQYRLAAYAEFSKFHPAFLYESLWSLLAFIVLFTLAKKAYKSLLLGELTALYLIFYAVGRILLETVRLDSRPMNLFGWELNMAVATFVSIVIALIMAGWVIVRRVKNSKKEQQVAAES